jgi:hypothetical protein
MAHRIVTDEQAAELAHQPTLRKKDVFDLLGVGDYGQFPCAEDCDADEAGVRAKELTAEDRNRLMAADIAEIERQRRCLELTFPCTPAELVDWCKSNVFDDLLPPAFIIGVAARPNPPPASDFQAAVEIEEHAECTVARFFATWSAYCQRSKACPYEGFRRLMDWGVTVKAGEFGTLGEHLAFEAADVSTAFIRARKAAKKSGGEALSRIFVRVEGYDDGRMPLAEFWMTRANVQPVYDAHKIRDFVWPTNDFPYLLPRQIEPAPRRPVQIVGNFAPTKLGLTATREDYERALRQDAWIAWEALCWLKGRNPAWCRRGFREHYPEEFDLIERAVHAGTVTGKSTSPTAWIAWARSKGWILPPELDVLLTPVAGGDVVIAGSTYIDRLPRRPVAEEAPEFLTIPAILALLADAYPDRDARESFRTLVDEGLVGLASTDQGTTRWASLRECADAAPEELEPLAAGLTVSPYELERTYWLRGDDRYPWRDREHQLCWLHITDEMDKDDLETYGEVFAFMAGPQYPPHDLAKLRQSLSCSHVICDHDPCPTVVNEPHIWTVVERVRNRGHAVDWHHWISLPTWTGAEAACLIYSVDPLKLQKAKCADPAFDEIPLDPLRERITKLTQLAERTLSTAPPLDWLEWARERGLSEEIHPRLTALVHRVGTDLRKAEGTLNSEHAEVSAPALSAPSKSESGGKPPSQTPGLETPEIAAIFDGTYWKSWQWKSNLSDCPKWLEPARMVKGRKGKRAATWNPFEIAKLLLGKDIDLRKLDRLFRTRVELKPWTEEWVEHEGQIKNFYE